MKCAVQQQDGSGRQCKASRVIGTGGDLHEGQIKRRCKKTRCEEVVWKTSRAVGSFDVGEFDLGSEAHAFVIKLRVGAGGAKSAQQGY